MTGDVRTDGTVDEHQRERDDHPIEPRTGPVRIIGAQRAGGPAGEDAVDEQAQPAGEAPEAGEFGPEDWQTAEPALPHWTEAPTGEVPAVLSRSAPGDEDDPWAAVPEPSWREEHADWDRVDALDAALRPGAGEGSLEEADPSEREPWSFELGGAGQGDEVNDEDLFATWDEQAAASGAGWGDDAGGARAGLSGGAHLPRDLEAGGGSEDPGHEEPWSPDDEAWDPDKVAGEKTTVMRLPEPPAMAEAEDQLPPPPAAPGGEYADVDEAELARHFARRGAPERQVHPEDLVADARGGDAYEDEALAADLEARRSRRPWGGRGDRGGRSATPELAPSLAVRAPSAGRSRREPGGPQGRSFGPQGPAGHAGVATGRRGDDLVSQRTGRNMPVAIASGVIIGALALVAFHFGTVPSMVVVTAVIGLAAVEAFAAFRRAGYHPATLLGLVAVVGLVIGSYVKTEEALPLVTALLVAGTFAWHLAGVDHRAEPVRSTAATLLVYCWVGVFGSFAAMLLAPSYFPDRHGIAYLLGALIAAVAYDVGALAVGAWVGRRPLSAVSPGKTWEGVFGGAVAALVLSVGVVHLIHPWTLGHSVILGVVVAVVSPIGDLSESMVKRRLGLKDMGRILPGHGGLLDRVDGLLFVLPATFYLVRAFHG